MTTIERRIITFAGISRAVVSLVAVATALLVAPYDTSNRLRQPASRVRDALSAFGNWDGVYFAHIATTGYDYEHVHAFFPLYPLLIRGVRALLTPLALHDEVAVPLAGWLVRFVVVTLLAIDRPNTRETHSLFVAMAAL
ncbi:hypothetical protein PINS_up011744 [Pythium insidiosum]|nr:hypothetical protein PINS_up011744 [Pythium insidiosum]